MLQNLYYLMSIISSVLVILILLVVLVLVIKLYKTISDAVKTAQEKADEIGRVVTEVGERSASFLSIATKNGENAAKAGTAVSMAMDAYFFLRSLFRKKR